MQSDKGATNFSTTEEISPKMTENTFPIADSLDSIVGSSSEKPDLSIIGEGVQEGSRLSKKPGTETTSGKSFVAEMQRMEERQTIPNVSKTLNTINQWKYLIADSLNFYKTSLEAGHSDCVAQVLTIQEYLESFLALGNSDCLTCSLKQSEERLLPNIDRNDPSKINLPLDYARQSNFMSEGVEIDAIVGDVQNNNADKMQEKPLLSDCCNVQKRKIGLSADDQQKKAKLSNNSDVIDAEVMFGIVPSNFPVSKLEKSHQEEIVKRLQNCKDKIKLKIKKLIFENGLIMVTCREVATVDLVRKISHKLQLPEMAVDVIYSDQLPLILAGIFESSSNDTMEQIVEFIYCQNAYDLQVEEWKVFDRKIKDGDDVEIVFSIPRKVLEVLERVNYTLEFKFSTVTLEKWTSPKDEDAGGNVSIDSDVEKLPPEEKDWTIAKMPLRDGMKFKDTTDQWYKKLLNEIKNKPRQYTEFIVEDGIIYKLFNANQATNVNTFKPYVPRDFIPEILKSVHDDIGHASFKIGFKNMSDKVYFDGSRKALKEYISRCKTCNASKLTKVFFTKSAKK